MSLPQTLEPVTCGWVCSQLLRREKWEPVLLFGSDFLSPLFAGPGKLPRGDSSTQHAGWLH